VPAGLIDKQPRAGRQTPALSRFREAEAERREKEEVSRKRDLTFGAIVEEYLSRHVKGQRKAAQVEREIRREIIPHWKDKPLAEITRSDVVELIDAIADRPAPYQAHNILGHIRTFFNWAIDRSKYGLEISPCDRLRPGRLIGEKKPRQRVLTDDEIAAFWRASKRLGCPYGPLFRLLAITGQRKSEVAEARWREFHPDLVRMLRDRGAGAQPVDWSKVDKSLKVWTVPPERFKSDASHLVPLSDEALAILETIPQYTGRSAGDHVFSTTFGARPVNGFSKGKERLDKFMLRSTKAMARQRGEDPANVMLADYVLHDVRRIVRTRLAIDVGPVQDAPGAPARRLSAGGPVQVEGADSIFPARTAALCQYPPLVIAPVIWRQMLGAAPDRPGSLRARPSGARSAAPRETASGAPSPRPSRRRPC
jgi:integrase